jgi:hypothetical protein
MNWLQGLVLGVVQGLAEFQVLGRSERDSCARVQAGSLQ